MHTKLFDLNSEGVVLHKFYNSQINFLWDEITEIQDNFANCKKANKDLVGQLEHQYYLSEESHNLLEKHIIRLSETYTNSYPEILKNIAILDNNLPFKLQSSWVNFQKKYEFNPVHSHPGVFSFVLWLKIPYNLEDEDNSKFCVESSAKSAGRFELFFQDTLGGLRKETLPVDKQFENCILLFPSRMHHCVYPFYTSDDYRISVSGNVFLKV